MKGFAKVVSSYQLFNYFRKKSPILDVWQDSKNASKIILHTLWSFDFNQSISNFVESEAVHSQCNNFK